jgi:hypothetical protein
MANYKDFKMLEATRQRVLAAVPLEGEGLTVEEIAAIMQRTVGTTLRQLLRLYEDGSVERLRIATKGAGYRCRWRQVLPGRWPPLYDPQPGFDIRALADCFGGYTFTNVVPTGGKCYGGFDQ